jgi:hypothetical protein
MGFDSTAMLLAAPEAVLIPYLMRRTAAEWSW